MVNFDITWLVAAMAITGSFLNINKCAACFYVWIACEVTCCALDIKNKQYGRAFLDLFCIGMNVYGIIAWSKPKPQRRKSNALQTTKALRSSRLS